MGGRSSGSLRGYTQSALGVSELLAFSSLGLHAIAGCGCLCVSSLQERNAHLVWLTSFFISMAAAPQRKAQMDGILKAKNRCASADYTSRSHVAAGDWLGVAPRRGAGLVAGTTKVAKWVGWFRTTHNDERIISPSRKGGVCPGVAKPGFPRSHCNCNWRKNSDTVWPIW